MVFEPSGYLENKWLIALAIILIFFIISRIFTWLANGIIRKLTKKTRTKFDDLLLDKSQKPITVIVILLGFRYAFLTLLIQSTYPKQIVDTLIVLVSLFWVTAITEVLMEAWTHGYAKKTKSKFDDAILPLLKNSSRVVFSVLALIFILRIWGVNVQPLLASLGIVGLVIGFALQNALSNVFGGISLVLDQTFKIGDKIKLTDGQVGLVHDIGIRSTRIKTFSNELISIPNGQLANMRIENYVDPDLSVRVDVNFGVEYGVKIEKIRKVVLESIKKLKVADTPEPQVLFLSMGDYALNFSLRFWVERYGDSWRKKLEATEAVYNALNKAKIGIPFPTQIIYMKK